MLSLDMFKESLNKVGDLNYAYIVDGKIIGILLANINYILDNSFLKARKICFIENIAVVEAFQQQGIGRKLYENLKNDLNDKNVNAIELNVWAFNKNAIKFYEALGMKVKNMRYEEVIQ